MASSQLGVQRAFVSKKSRATAADMRMHIRSGGIVLPYQNNAESDGANTVQLNLSDVVDCVDVEEILSQRKTSAVYDISSSTTSLSTPRALSEFPADDVEVRQVEREWGTADPPVDIKTVPVEAEAHSVLTTLNDPLSLVHRKLVHLCSGDALQKLLRERDTVISPHVYEGDRESLHRVTRSASLVDKESGSKRTSYTSCNSTGTAGSSEANNGRLHDSTPDDALSGIVDRISISQMDEENELKRNASRHPVTVGLLFPKDESELVEVRVQPPFPENRSGFRLFVKVIKLRMEMQSEPIYGSLTLFDIRQKKRISESFHFDLNPVQFRGEDMLSDAISQCQQAAFALSSPLSDVVIMVKLEKILFGCDPSEAYDNYVAFCRDERYREKVKEVAAQFTNRLSDYRMVLAVMFIDLSRFILNGGENGEGTSMMVSTLSQDGSVPLAEDDSSSILSADRVSVSTTSTFKRIGSGTSASTVLNKMRTPLARRKNTQSSMDESPEMVLLRGPPHHSLPSLQPINLTLNNFIKVESDKVSDEELVKIAIEQRRNGGKNKKNFPVEISLKIWGDNGDEVDGRITGEGRMVGSVNDTTMNSSTQEITLTQEVDQLPHCGQYNVNLVYRNTMLLYPRWVNMSGRSGTARNICVKIELMNSREEPQMVFFDRFTKRPTATFARTTVLYHSKTPQLWDEIKVSIPPILDDGHHFLFTFYHVSCKTSNKDDPVEFPLGYSWLPLLPNKRLANGEFSLPIALEKLPQSYGYLPPDGRQLPNMKWLDGQKAAFSIGCVSITTVHPQDDHLERFLTSFSSLSSCKPVNESELVTSIQGILKARPEPMIAFLYQIMDALLTLVANPPYSKMTSSTCFSTLGQLAKICTQLVDSPSSDQHGRGVLLPTYIHYFKIGAKESRPWSAECREMAKESNELASPDSEKIFHIIEDMERSRNVKANPVEIAVHNTNKLVHEELADLWVGSSGSTKDRAFNNSFFFLELISKSMAEFLSMTGRLFLPRKSRFSDRFCRSLASLSEMITNEVINDCKSQCRVKQTLSTTLTSSWAFFLRDSLSLMDRSFVFKLIAHFNRELIREINSTTKATEPTLLKLNFLRIISSHEHFILLNLPNIHNGLPSTSSMMNSFVSSPQHIASSLSLQPPSSPGGSSLSSKGSSGGSIMSDLTSEYRSRHFLLGLILSDLSSILDSSSSDQIRSSILSLITSLLAAHETDPRIGDAQMKNRVCSLYTPLLGIVIDNVHLLLSNEKKTNSLSSSRLNENRRKMDESSMGVDPQVALAIAGMGGDDMIAPSPSLISPFPPLRPPLNHEQTRQLLMSVCWVLRSLDRSTLRGWLRDLSPHRLIALLDVLTLVVSSFEYKAIQDDGLEGITEAVDMDETIRVGRREGREGDVKWRDTRMESIDHLESLVCAEATLTVLDTIESTCQVVSSAGCDHLLPILPLLFKLIMHMLSCRQSLSVLQSVFATQRSFVVKYPDVVFETESEQCGELCLQLLRHCASRMPIVRSHAAASAYLLMRESYESTTSLARVKMHFTMSLSTLVSNGTQSGSWINEDFLRRSFRTLLSYAHNESSAAQETSLQSFCEQVKDLVFNMHMILSDTVRIKEFRDDFEMSMDLIYRIAKGYQNNPDLRVRWLLDMSTRAEKKGCFAEAAQCVIHSAALVAEYLAMRPCTSHLPSGANSFSSLSDNVLEESAVSDDVISPDTDGICESKHFKEEGLIDLCVKAFNLLEKAFQYEMMPHIFEILSPILSHSRDYRHLSHLHRRLGESLVKIKGQIKLKEHTTDAWLSPLRSSDKRCFGTYFRVAFFGSKFGDIDGEEYVYKSAPYMKLSDFAYDFEKYYSERFPLGVFHVIKDSNNVSRDTLDPSRAYLQVTYVEPYLEEWERRERTTNFERNHNLSRFAYATPFTRDGRAHGELKDQYKRRTILTVHNSFPYVKTRIRVVEREQRVLSPIEVAIEDVEKKTRELGAAIAQSPPDAKMLQMVLQGCIGTTVNQGPVEVANVFLSNVTDGQPMDNLQNKLRLAFRNFSKKCADALSLNKQLIHADQLAYQNELNRNYTEFTRKMAPMLSKAPRPISALIKSTVTPETLEAVSVI